MTKPARDDWDELGETLRAAVEEARGVPVPVESLQRSLERAAALRKKGGPRLTSRYFLAVSALAAGLLLGLGLRQAARSLRAGKDPAVAIAKDSLPRSPGQRLWSGGQDLRPIALDDDWDRALALRDLASSQNRIDQAGLDRYIRQRLPHRAPAAPALVSAEGRPLPLLLVSVQSTIRGARARTLIDLVFSADKEAAATDAHFSAHLPDGASPSYFALFPGSEGPAGQEPLPPKQTRLPSPTDAARMISTDCWGRPRVAAILPLEGRAEPEPGENWIRGAVGKLRPRSRVRVLLAYEQTIPTMSGRLAYAYPLPSVLLDGFSFVLEADAEEARGSALSFVGAERKEADGLVTYRVAKKRVKPSGQLVYTTRADPDAIDAVAGEDADGRRYLHAQSRSGADVRLESEAEDVLGSGPVVAARINRAASVRLVAGKSIRLVKVGQEPLAGRAWAEIAVAGLEEVPGMERLALAYGQSFSVPGKKTALALPEQGPPRLNPVRERSRVGGSDLAIILRRKPSGQR